MAEPARKRKEEATKAVRILDAEPPPSDAQCIKLALWYIDKCGGSERALRAMRAACGAVKVMEK